METARSGCAGKAGALYDSLALGRPAEALLEGDPVAARPGSTERTVG